MPDSPPAPRDADSPDSRPLWVAVAVLLLIAIVVPLLVWFYDRTDPTLWGFPFYYWFQFLLVPFAAILTTVAFRLSQAATVRDRRRRGQDGPAAQPGGERR